MIGVAKRPRTASTRGRIPALLSALVVVGPALLSGQQACYRDLGGSGQDD